LRKFSTKKFLSNSLIGVPVGLGEALADGEAAVVVVVAGDIAAVDGVVPGIGERPGAVAAGLVVVAVVVAGLVTGAVAGLVTGAVAGLMAVVGGAPGGLLAGDVAGGWPNEVSARVTVQRLAISSVFIGLIRMLSRPRFPMSWVSSPRS
jgi:hypothetical protein